MGVAGGMEHTSASICHMGHDADEVEVVHEADSILACSLQSKGNNATSAVRHILLCQGVVLVRGQTSIVNP